MWPHSAALLPEEDAIDGPEEEDETDPMTPGDLWYLLSLLKTEPAQPQRILLA